MLRTKGFTLIELLIVVAIIAILAAIAVPNFLEAQVRSKVSRAQADMRSLAVAIEAYSVDYNKYPIGYINIRQSGYAAFPTSKYERNPYALSKLTTPVAYVTSIFTDPFSVGGGFLFDRTDDIEAQNGFPFWYDDYLPHEEYFGTVADGYAYTRFRRIHQKGYTWSLSSAGPERSQMMMWLALDGELPANANNHIIYPYDPSNGTVSEGFVGRTNKGVYTEVNQP